MRTTGWTDRSSCATQDEPGERVELILAIDGGATRTRAVVVDRDGRVRGRGEAGPANHLLADRAVVRQSLSDAIDRALGAASAPRSAVRCVAAGLAGVDDDGAGAEDVRPLLAGFDWAAYAIVGDMVIAHVAALDGQPGVMALAGTGSAILGIGPDDVRARIGGWGPLFGNEGSAYGIGQRALVAAAHAYDGLGPATALVDAITSRLGLRDFRDTLDAVYAANMGMTGIAALAPIVAGVAERGDDVSHDILVEAGTYLADGTAVVVTRLRLAAPHRRVSYQGPVLETCTSVREAFIERLAVRMPDVRVEPPKHAPVMGAVVLGRKALGWTDDTSAEGRFPKADPDAGGD